MGARRYSGPLGRSTLSFWRSGAMRASPWRRGIGLAASVVLTLALALWILDRCYPLPLTDTDGAMVVVSADGTPLRNYPSRDGIWRYPVDIKQVSPYYLQTLLTYEDRWFYWHPGFNPVALARAGWQWLMNRHIVSGGSTLTMQVARLIDPQLAGKSSRRLSVKLRQIARAIQLEMHYSKSEILSLYLAHAPMGGIVEGVEMGARLWLGKSASALSPAEAALLTALPQAPSRLRPDRHPEAAQAARDKILDRMAALGRWTDEAVADAKIENVIAPPLRARWLAPLAAARLSQAHTGARTGDSTRPTVVASTIDSNMQSTVERMLLDRVDTLPAKVSMAVLVMDNDSLEIKVYAGSADFSDDTRYAHVDMVRGVRSPGSTLKPFLYGQALDEGLIDSESLLLDVPMSFNGYAPGNFQATFSGPISVSEALQESLNVPAVDLLDRVGPTNFASMLLAGGIRLRLPLGSEPNLSLILGGAGTTLEELVGAYRALARDGLSGRPRLEPSQPRVESRMMSEGAAWIVRDILEGSGHPDRPFDQSNDAGRQLAWKTGTSFGFRDAWAIGVTNSWTIGVWVGRPDNTPNPGFFGANVAAPLLRDIVAALPEGETRARVRPHSVQAVFTCWPEGYRVNSGLASTCSRPRTAWALNETVPPSFAGYADMTQQSLRMSGLTTGTILRPVPGRREVAVEVGVQGTTGEVWWMLDGQVVGRAQSSQPYTMALAQNGRYTMTVMDSRGRYDRVIFDVVGVAP